VVYRRGRGGTIPCPPWRKKPGEPGPSSLPPRGLDSTRGAPPLSMPASCRDGNNTSPHRYPRSPPTPSRTPPHKFPWSPPRRDAHGPPRPVVPSAARRPAPGDAAHPRAVRRVHAR
jgi:hypothetical protein